MKFSILTTTTLLTLTTLTALATLTTAAPAEPGPVTDSVAIAETLDKRDGVSCEYWWKVFFNRINIYGVDPSWGYNLHENLHCTPTGFSYDEASGVAKFNLPLGQNCIEHAIEAAGGPDVPHDLCDIKGWF